MSGTRSVTGWRQIEGNSKEGKGNRMSEEEPAAAKPQGFETVDFDDKLRLYYCEYPLA